MRFHLHTLKSQYQNLLDTVHPPSKYSEELTSQVHVFHSRNVNDDLNEFAEEITGTNLEDIVWEDDICIFEYLLYPGLDTASLKEQWRTLAHQVDLTKVPKKIYYVSKEMQEFIFEENVYCIVGYLTFIDERYLWFTGIALKKENDGKGKRELYPIPASPKEELVYV